MSEDIKNITKEELWKKIKGFMARWDQKPMDDVIDFLQFLVEYPESMCKNDMTQTLKELIAEKYFEGVEKPIADDKYSKTHDPSYLKPYYDFEDLSVLFDRSKASIHEAVKVCSNLRPAIKKACEESALRAYEWSKAQEIVARQLGRYPERSEVEAYIHEQEVQSKDLENKEYAEFLEWKKVQRIKEQ